MKEFGGKAEWTGDNLITIYSQPYKAIPYYVESDWSAASYWYEMAALSDEACIELPGLFEKSFQGDAKVAELFEQLGVSTEYGYKSVTLRKSGKHTEIMEYDFVNQPDLAQTFVVTCCMMGIPFRFSGLQSLKIKETDRIAALITEMRKLGYIISESNGSELSWKGERCESETNPAIDTYEDHRMAMAFAPAALKLKNIRINNPHVVSKSYPKYWEDLTKAGLVLRRNSIMWILVIALIGVTLFGLIAGYFYNRNLQKKIDRGEITEEPQVVEVDSECCGQHETCEKDSLLAAVSKKIEYYDDEELDRFKGRPSDSYTEEEVEEFRDIMYSTQEVEVAGWCRSLQLRGIEFPDELKDELFLIVGERRIH